MPKKAFKKDEDEEYSLPTSKEQEEMQNEIMTIMMAILMIAGFVLTIAFFGR